MKKIFGYILAMVIFTGCSTLKVSVDYDETYDFSKVETFAVDGNYEQAKNTLFNDRVVAALENELQLKSYKKVTPNSADLIFVFHSNVREKSDIQTSYGLSGYRGYRYGGMMMSTTNTYNYNEGTLIIDALNPKTKKIVWRGTGVKELRENKTPQERTQAVNEAIKKIMTKFPK